MINVSLRVKQKIIDVLRQEPSVEKAVLFGSRARGDCHDGSDIDLALIGDQIPLYLNTRLRNSAGLYTLDIVHYNEVTNALLKQNILQDGKVIYQKNE